MNKELQSSKRICAGVFTLLLMITTIFPFTFFTKEVAMETSPTPITFQDVIISRMDKKPTNTQRFGKLNMNYRR